MDYYRYRLLNQNENPSMGIAAADPDANVSVLDHVSNGSLKTQYISTCRTLEAVKDFASKGFYIPGETKTIVEIDVSKLSQLVQGCKIIDLTQPGDLEMYIPIMQEPILQRQRQYNQRARNFATKFQEVLIIPGRAPDPVTGRWVHRIPAECIKVVAFCHANAIITDV